MTATRSGSSSRARVRRAQSPAKQCPAPGWSPLQENVAGRACGDLRQLRVATLEPPSRLDRLGQADDVRRHRPLRAGLPRGFPPHPGGDPPPLALAGSAARAGSARKPHTPVSTDELLGTVAVVGFPNVGKSTLVNRLTGSRQAVVHETPGVTRDRKEVVCEWAGQRFLLVDTGGVDVADPSPLTKQVAEQARRAIAEADLVLFVVDTKTGITPGDEELAAILRRSRKPIFLIANKIDEPGTRGGGVRVPPARPRRSDPDLIRSRARHRRPPGRDHRAAARQRPGAGRGGSDPRRDPRPPERRQVEPAQRAARRGARDRLRAARHDARLDRHRAQARRPDVRPRRHRGHPPQAQAAPGNRVLLGAAGAAGRRAGRRRARPRRRQRGRRRAGQVDRGPCAQDR